MTKIFINPGHGSEPGAVNHNLHLEERNLAYQIGEALVDYLHSHTKLETVLYQQVKSLNEVPAQANKSQADLFVSIHMNANKPNTASGVEVLYCEGSEAGKLFAKKVLNNIVQVKDYTFKNRGVKDDSNRHLCVLRKTKMTSCLVEMGFIDNDKEAKFVQTHIRECAEAIGKGILDFLNYVVITNGDNNQSAITDDSDTVEQPLKNMIIKASEISGKFDLYIGTKAILVGNRLSTISNYIYQNYPEFVV